MTTNNKFDGMTTAELCEMRDVVTGEMADIRAQIEHAKAEAASTGRYSDPSWFVKAKQALRHRGIQHQNLLQEIARRNREDRKKIDAAYQSRFITAARRLLPFEVFMAINDEAKREQAA